MSLSADAVGKIARLAQLALSEADIPGYARDLSDILDLVEAMERVSTEGVLPMAHPQDAEQRLRPDEVTEANQREVLQSGAPLTEAGLYLVPKVIE